MNAADAHFLCGFALYRASYGMSRGNIFLRWCDHCLRYFVGRIFSWHLKWIDAVTSACGVILMRLIVFLRMTSFCQDPRDIYYCPYFLFS